MNEKNIILLAALGFGAYYLLTRRAAAATGSYVPAGAGAAQTQNNQPSTKNALIEGGFGLLSQWLGNQPTQQQINTELASEIAYYGAAPDGQAVNVAQAYAENYYSYRGDN
jgi:hypothetical protein